MLPSSRAPSPKWCFSTNSPHCGRRAAAPPGRPLAIGAAARCVFSGRNHPARPEVAAEHADELAQRSPSTRDVAAAAGVRSRRRSGLLWEWSPAVLGALCALPAAVVVVDDRSQGLALAVGVLPAAIIGLAPTRRARFATVVLGASIGVPMFLGGFLSGVPVIAVASIAILGVVSALLAARSRLGQIVLSLSLPMAINGTQAHIA